MVATYNNLRTGINLTLQGNHTTSVTVSIKSYKKKRVDVRSNTYNEGITQRKKDKHDNQIVVVSIEID